MKQQILIMTHIYLCRHGETTENKQQILQGHLPGHLSAKGIEQAESLRDYLTYTGIHFDTLLVSDLKRTLDTANIINQRLHLPIVSCTLLRERDWGSYTGIDINIARNSPIPQDAESVEQMFQRAQKFLMFVANNYHEQTILAIGHGLFNRTIQACLSECTIQDIPRFNNCEVRHLQFERLPLSFSANQEQIISAD